METPDFIAKDYHRQRQRYLALSQPEFPIQMPGNDRLGVTPANVITFANDLLLCPSEDAAVAHMRRGLTTAAVFLDTSQSVADEFGKGNVQLTIPNAPGRTPFFVLAFVVRQQCLLVKEQFGDKWNEFEK